MCNCIPGKFHCPQAEFLWALVKLAYLGYNHGVGTWEDYKAALKRYEEHIDLAREGRKEQDHG